MKIIIAVSSSFFIWFFLSRCAPVQQSAPGMKTLQVYEFIQAKHETGTLYTVCLKDGDSVLVVSHYNRHNPGTKWHRFYSYENNKLQPR